MDRDPERDQRILDLIRDFSDFIRVQILLCRPSKFGLDPEDIAQNVKIKIWKLFSGEKKVTHYPSYIRKIVSSAVIDELRRLRREDILYVPEGDSRIEESRYAYVPDETRLKNLEMAVAKAVDGLIRSRREVVKLYLLNLSVPEIADYLHWSRDKTRNLLYRGLADLRKRLREMDIDHEPRG